MRLQDLPVRRFFGRPLLRGTVLLSLWASLSGCTVWVKPGATPAMRDAQVAQCQAIAYQRVPAAMMTVQTSPGGWQPAQQECWKDNGVKKCRTRDGYYERPRYDTRDMNEPARDALFDDCMYSNGYVKN